MKLAGKWLLALLVLQFVPCRASGQQFEEYAFALEYRAELIRQYGTIQGTAANLIGESVFEDLTRSLSSSYGAKQYELTILGDQSPNALSVGGGKIFVDSGFVPLLGQSRGLWAAVLGHELSHDLLRHAYRNYILAVQAEQTRIKLQQAEAHGGSSAQVGLLAIAAIANQLVDLKIRRDEESEADRTGMVIMARAGYHPDFALELNRIMTQRLGDSSRFAAFFQTHPRFATRAIRELREYDQAEAEFSRLWPDALQSPGGVPPPVAIIMSLTSSQSKPSNALVLNAEIEVHNVDPSTLVVFAAFSDHGRPVYSNDQRNSINRALVGRGTLARTGPRMLAWTASIPTSALPNGRRKLQATLAVGINDSQSVSSVLDVSAPTHVEFPK